MAEEDDDSEILNCYIHVFEGLLSKECNFQIEDVNTLNPEHIRLVLQRHRQCVSVIRVGITHEISGNDRRWLHQLFQQSFDTSLVLLFVSTVGLQIRDVADGNLWTAPRFSQIVYAKA